MNTKEKSQIDEKKPVSDKVLLADVSESTVEVANSELENKPRRRKSSLKNLGPLGTTPEIPGYRTYWAIDGDPRRPNRIHNLTTLDDYDRVTPEEAGGLPVEIDAGHGMKHILLKKPMEYHLEDTERRVKENMDKIYGAINENHSNHADIKETSEIIMKK